MATYDCNLMARYDDVAGTVTITGVSQPPPGPAEIPWDQWHGQTGPGFEVTLPVGKRNTLIPTAIYEVPGTFPPVRRLVEYRNGSWQMPGTLYTGP